VRLLLLLLLLLEELVGQPPDSLDAELCCFAVEA
jgi:hypothetical protein